MLSVLLYSESHFYRQDLLFNNVMLSYKAFPVIMFVVFYGENGKYIPCKHFVVVE